MTTTGTLFIACIAAAVAGWVGFHAGVFTYSRDRIPLEIEAECAHYDMDTGEFTWGAKPVSVDPMVLPNLPLEHPRPARKPRQP